MMMMRLAAISATLIAVSTISSSGAAFQIRQQQRRGRQRLTTRTTRTTTHQRSFSTSLSVVSGREPSVVAAGNDADTQQQRKEDATEAARSKASPLNALASAEVRARLDAQLARLRLKDSTSKKLTKEVSGEESSFSADN